jgi:hypothetical protein
MVPAFELIISNVERGGTRYTFDTEKHTLNYISNLAGTCLRNGVI